MNLGSKNTNTHARDLFKIFSEEQKKALVRIVENYRQNSLLAAAQIAEAMSQFAPMVEFIQERMADAAVKIAELREQYRTAIQEGITNFENPEDYDSSSVIIHPLTRGFSISSGIDMLDDIKDSHFDYLYDRYNEGIEAYFTKDFQKSIFTFLSCLDGILKEFCEQHKATDCPYKRRFPTHEETSDHLMLHWRMQFAADNAQFQDRLEAFFEHRHQIMHGDRNANFDENIATISLLFLGLVFYTVKDNISCARKSPMENA